MGDWNPNGKALSELLRTRTMPLGIKLLSTPAQFPEKARRPWQSMGIKIPVCQAFSMARLYGWTIGMTAEDVNCPSALALYGWIDLDPAAAKDTLTKFMLLAGYASDEAAAVRQVESFRPLERGQCAGILISPLERIPQEPDLVMVYGNPAQMARLLHAATYHDGQPVTSSFSGRAGTCGSGLLTALQTGAYQVAIPGTGDRAFSMAQDDEMAFIAPASKLGELVTGLSLAGKNVGVRYPIPPYLRFSPEFPALYSQTATTTGSKE
ncbi:MAG: DUF169 domain-containing protein [Chloroflexota bacterium]|mgnify:CR=1 FL=1